MRRGVVAASRASRGRGIFVNTALSLLPVR